MAEAIIGRLVKEDKYQLHVVELNPARQAELVTKYGVYSIDSSFVLFSNDVVILAVKPQLMKKICSGLNVNGAIVISIASGISVNVLSDWLNYPGNA